VNNLPKVVAMHSIARQKRSYMTDLAARTSDKRVEMNVSVVKVSLHVVVVVAVPRREDDAVLLGRAEVDHDVVGVRDVGWQQVDLEVFGATERDYWRI